jgi:hypothetical protein
VGVLDEGVAHPLDGLQRRDRAQHGVVVEHGKLGHGANGTLSPPVARNGKQRPVRPRIEVRQATAGPEEAAAIAAAIEQFLRDTAPPPGEAGPALSPWLRTGLFEGAGLPASAPSPWGDPDPWGTAR